VKGNTFRSAICKDCNCELGFGQRKADGKLYPRIKTPEGSYLPNNGWKRWEGAGKTAAADDPF
jgi:hypothetical protein